MYIFQVYVHKGTIAIVTFRTIKSAKSVNLMFCDANVEDVLCVCFHAFSNATANMRCNFMEAAQKPGHKKKKIFKLFRGNEALASFLFFNPLTSHVSLHAD